MNHSTAPEPEAVLENVRWVRTLALQLIGHTVQAEDLAQETWVRVLRNPPPQGVSFEQWTVGTMRRVHWETSRRRRQRRERELRVAEERLRASAEATVARVEVEQDMVGQVLELGEPLRRTVLARYFEQMDVREIARREGISTSTVRTRLSRAYSELRARLQATPESAAGAFVCLALKEVSPVSAGPLDAAGSTASSKAAAAGTVKAVAVAAALLGFVALDVLWFGSSDGSSRGTSDEVALAAQPAVEAKSPAGDPAGEPGGKLALATVERSRVAAAPDPESAAPGVSAAGAEDSGLLTVRVLDYLGDPIEGIPFVVAFPGASTFSRTNQWAVSGPPGSPATVSCEAFQGRPTRREVELTVPSLGLDLEPLTVDLDDLPTAPLDFVIPSPFGSVSLEFTDPEGNPLSESVSGSVMGIPDSTGLRAVKIEAEAGKPALIVPVALDQSWRILTTPDAGWLSSFDMIAGPTSHLATATQRVMSVVPLPTVELDLAVSDESLWPESQDIQVEFTPADGSPGPKSTIVDRRGPRGLAITFGGIEPPGVEGTLSITVQERAGREALLVPGTPLRQLGAKLDIQLPEGRERLRLGQVQLQPFLDEITVRVLDSQGLPVRLASVVPYGPEVRMGLDVWRQRRGAQRFLTDDNGQVKVGVSAEGEAIAFLASRGTAAKSWLVAPAVGAHEVELRLQSTSDLMGRVTLPSGADTERLSVRVASSEEPLLRDHLAKIDAEGNFLLKGLTAGTVDLELIFSGSSAALATLEGVPVGTATPDPRLDPWRLDQELSILRFRIEREDGQERGMATVHVAKQVHRIQEDAEAAILLPAEPTLLSIDVMGCRQFVATTDSLPAVVNLRRGLEVQIDVQAGPISGPILDRMQVGLYRHGTVDRDVLPTLPPLEWLAEAGKLFWCQRLPSDSERLTSHLCSQPGEYYIRFMERVGEGAIRPVNPADLPEAMRTPRIQVLDVVGTQRFQFQWD